MCLAVPGEIVDIAGEDLARTGTILFGTVKKSASLAFIPDAAVGDYVLVHAGIAISKVNETEARRIFGYLEEIDEVSG